MRGKDHPQGAGGLGRWGEAVLGAVPLSHQPHEELVGPGDAECRTEPLLLGAEMGDGPLSLRTTVCAAPGPGPRPVPRLPWCCRCRTPLLHGLRHLEGPDQGQLWGPHCCCCLPIDLPKSVQWEGWRAHLVDA